MVIYIYIICISATVPPARERVVFHLPVENTGSPLHQGT